MIAGATTADSVRETKNCDVAGRGECEFAFQLQTPSKMSYHTWYASIPGIDDNDDDVDCDAREGNTAPSAEEPAIVNDKANGCDLHQISENAWKIQTQQLAIEVDGGEYNPNVVNGVKYGDENAVSNYTPTPILAQRQQQPCNYDELTYNGYVNDALCLKEKEMLEFAIRIEAIYQPASSGQSASWTQWQTPLQRSQPSAHVECEHYYCESQYGPVRD